MTPTDATPAIFAGGRLRAAPQALLRPALPAPSCRRSADDEERVLVDAQVMDVGEPAEERAPIVCRRCRNEITAVEHVIAVDGRHEHTFTNPAGITFRIGCFADAYGCSVEGAPTREFTWFRGYGWCICACSRCRTHLGWLYLSDGAHFFGLILDNLERRVELH